MKKFGENYSGEEKRKDPELRQAIEDLKNSGFDTTRIEQDYPNLSDEEIADLEKHRKALAEAYGLPEDTHWDVLTQKVQESLNRSK